MTNLITGIHHVAMKCCGQEEFQKTLAFYQDVLGLPVLRRWGSGKDEVAMLDCGGGLIEIFADGEESLPQGVIRHFALAVSDVDAVVEKVAAAGFVITRAPEDVDIESDPVCPVRIAFCLGPLGEEIEFFHER
jgi:glyoxylase I family protein